MRSMLIAFGLFMATLASRGDVIDGRAVVDTGDSNNQLGLTLGDYSAGWNSYANFFTFQTGSSSAGTGRWKLDSLVVNLKTDNSTSVNYSGGNAGLYKLFSGTTYNLVATQAFGSGTISNTGTGSAITVNFASNSSFGILGNNNSGLLANTQYLMALDFNFTTSADDLSAVWVQNNNGSYTTNSGWVIGTSYGSTLTPGGGSISTTAGDQASSFAYNISAQAVPEPGTLLLGSFLSTASLAGWGFRRLGRKKQ